MKGQNLFYGNDKKNIICVSPAEFVQRLVNVNRSTSFTTAVKKYKLCKNDIINILLFSQLIINCIHQNYVKQGIFSLIWNIHNISTVEPQ